MACDTPLDAFRMATEHLTDHIHREASFRDIAINLFPREEAPRGVGLVQSTFTIGRSEPTDDLPDFDPITLADSDGASGVCATTYNPITVGMNERTFAPEKFGWRGITVCEDDLIYRFKGPQFLEGYIEQMTINTIRTIGNRLWAIFDHLVPKFVAMTGGVTIAGGTGTPPKVPNLTLPLSTCQLDQSMLDDQAQELSEDGVTNPDSSGWIEWGEEGPLMPLYISSQMSKALLTNNVERRQDYRWADPMMLLARVGAKRTIGNYNHIPYLFPPRYSYDGTKYVRVPTWVGVAGTKGTVSNVNPNWRNPLTAPYEGARILNPLVFTEQLIRPVGSAAGLNWGAKDYMGTLKWVLGGDKISTTKCFDPTDKLGAHFAEYAHWPRPVKPQYGRLIIYKRCVGNYNCIPCSYS